MVYRNEMKTTKPGKFSTVTLLLKQPATKEYANGVEKRFEIGMHVTIRRRDALRFDDGEYWTMDDFQDMTEGQLPSQDIETDYFTWEVA